MAGILAVGVVALTVCAVATGSVARGLRSAELPHLLKAGPLNRTTSAKQALQGLDPEFRPKTALRLFLREGFRAGIEQDLNGTGFWKNKVGGYDVSAQFANPSAAAAVVAYFHRRSLGFCLKVCDVQIKDLAVPGIPGGLGAHRYRLTKTRFGQAFDYYYVVFAVGPWAYAVNMIGPPGTITANEVIAAAKALYKRASG